MDVHSSTRNVRIERLWVEVGTQFARAWKGFFVRLERMHGLDRGKPVHLWLLHLLFLTEIDKDCAEFQTTWNSHSVSRVGKNKTPSVSVQKHICMIVSILLPSNLLSSGNAIRKYDDFVSRRVW